MSLFTNFAKVFGIVSVKERGNQVIITGIDGLVMAKYISTIWETNIINRRMFTAITSSSMSFNKFFVPDVIYLLTKMHADPQCSWYIKNTLAKIIKGLMDNTWFKCSLGDVTPMTDPQRMNQLKWKPMPKQLEFLHAYGDALPRYNLRGFLLASFPGTGKAQPLDTLIKIPGGRKSMGDIVSGDIVITPDGGSAHVIAVYPQGDKDVYRLTFEDGRTTECCEDHLWKIHDGQDWSIDFLRNMLHKQNLSIPLIKPEDNLDHPEIGNPYKLGTNVVANCGHTLLPNCVFESSLEQKMGVIQGVMDAGGNVDNDGTVYFECSSIILSKQIQMLIWSIGGICSISEQGILRITVPNPRDLFRLLCKKIRVKTHSIHPDSLRLKITAINWVGKKPVQCISIDHPDHLYITDDYIVTRNTFSDLLIATCVIPPSIAEIKIIISPKKAVHLVWEQTIKSVFKIVPKYWCYEVGKTVPLSNTEYYIFSFEGLGKAVELGRFLNSQGKRFFVIVDESHNFADHRSLQTQRLVELQTINDKTYFIWASGSPILKSAAELTSYLKCADPTFDADAEKRFRAIYGTNRGRAAEIFNHRLGKMMAFIVPKPENNTRKVTVVERPVKLPPSLSRRFLMTSVREDMKEFIEMRLDYYSTIMRDLRKVVNDGLDIHESSLRTKSERLEFDEYIKTIKTISRYSDRTIKDLNDAARTYERVYLLPSLPPTFRKGFRSALSAIKNLKLKVTGEALGTILGRRRAECAAVLARYCKPDEIIKQSLSKTLFFSYSVAPLKILEKDLIEKGYNPCLIYGATNTNLTKIMQDFERDPMLNPACATMQSLSEAVPVTAASTVVLLNRPYRQATYDQVVARADRIGQKHPVTVIEVTLDTGDEPNVSSTADAILNDVRDTIAQLIGSEFAGPDPDDRLYQNVIETSEEDANIDKIQDEMG